jgi:ABC-type uncharacterized transport system fused permease/ATPase subunit
VTSSLDEETGLELYKMITNVLPKETILISVIHRKELLQFHTHLGEIKNCKFTITPITEEMLENRKNSSRPPCPTCSPFQP